MPYTIGQMAEKLGVAPSTLRYYDKEGLLPFVERTAGGIRIFSDGDLETLKIINCPKDTGMQIKDIRNFMAMVVEGDSTIDDRLELFRKRKEQVEKQMEELQKTLDIIQYKCWYYETAKKAGTTAAPDRMSDGEIPEQMAQIRARFREKEERK